MVLPLTEVSPGEYEVVGPAKHGITARLLEGHLVPDPSVPGYTPPSGAQDSLPSLQDSLLLSLRGVPGTQVYVTEDAGGYLGRCTVKKLLNNGQEVVLHRDDQAGRRGFVIATNSVEYIIPPADFDPVQSIQEALRADALYREERRRKHISFRRESVPLEMPPFFFTEQAASEFVFLDVGVADAVKGIKDKIETKTGISAGNQSLTLLGERLDESRFMYEYNSNKATKLHLVLHNYGPLAVTVMDDKTNTFKIETDAAATVDSMKRKLQEIASVPVDEQELIFAGKPECNDTVVSDYMMHESTRHIFLRLTTRVEISVENVVPPKSKITLDVEPSWTLEDIQRLTQRVYGIPSDHQMWFIAGSGQRLERGRSVADCNCRGLSTVDMMLSILGVPQISAKTVSGEIYRTEVKPSDSTADLKSKVHFKTGVPPDQQEIFVGEKLLSEEGILADHIKTETRVACTLRIRGYVKLFVETGVSEAYVVHTATTATVRTVKEEIGNKMGLCVLSQPLICDDAELEDGRALSDYFGDGRGPFFAVEVQGMLKVAVDAGVRGQFDVTIGDTQSGKDLKFRVCQELVLPTDHVKILWKGSEVAHDSSLSMMHENTGPLAVEVNTGMEIYVEADKKEFTLTVSASDTIKTIKALAEELGVNLENQVLCYEVTPLCAEKTLEDYNIRNGDYLDVLARRLFGCTEDLDNPILDYSMHLYLLAQCPLRLALVTTSVRSASTRLELSRLSENPQYRVALLGMKAALEILNEDPTAKWQVSSDTIGELDDLLESCLVPSEAGILDDETAAGKYRTETLASVLEMVAAVSPRMVTDAEEFGDYFVEDWARSKIHKLLIRSDQFGSSQCGVLANFLRRCSATDPAARGKLIDNIASRVITALRGTKAAKIISRSLVQNPDSAVDFKLISRLEGSHCTLSADIVQLIRKEAWDGCHLVSKEIIYLCRRSAVYDPDASVRIAALRYLSTIDKAAVAEALRDTNAEVRKAAFAIVGPQALEVCTTPHLVILALTQEGDEMTDKVKEEFRKRVGEDAGAVIRDIHSVFTVKSEVLLHVLSESIPNLPTRLPQHPPGSPHCSGGNAQRSAGHKRKALTSRRVWDGIVEQATPMRSQRVEDPIEEPTQLVEGSEQISLQISSCGSSARNVAAFCSNLSEDDLNSLAWW
ncbi:hypothetical protein FOL47_003515 [Perkinsus chesapeaki]|uniref:Ubiquitin-like domain-containing protein n=1 Tax=Perkinsus chesapeaki TaxID=330153 RepID=A0A7J6N0A4_PERCH|nr:hypothetical protein FOL47_003515 [Perkinsus chesapeaki]